MVTADMDMTDRTLWLPRMPYGGSRLLAAAFHSIGFDARVTPESDARTLELGGKYTSGDECYPQKVVMGDFMKLIEDERLDPKKSGLHDPHGQRPLPLRPVRVAATRGARRAGLDDVLILSLTSADGYAGIGEHAGS